MMIFAYLRMKFSSLKMNSERSFSDARHPARSSSAPARPPPTDIDPPAGTASRTCLRAPVAASAFTAALRLVAPGARSSASASSPSETIECGILERTNQPDTATVVQLSHRQTAAIPVARRRVDRQYFSRNKLGRLTDCRSG